MIPGLMLRYAGQFLREPVHIPSGLIAIRILTFAAMVITPTTHQQELSEASEFVKANLPSK